MLSFALTFLTGIVILQFFPHLPSLIWVSVLTLCSLIFWFFNLPHRLWLLGFSLGFAWCLWQAHSIADFSLPPNWEGKPLSVTGQLASLPRLTPYQTSFLFKVTDIQFEKENQKISTMINLSWQHPPHHSQVGDQWQLPLHLKKIHSTANPGGFDYEAWAFQNGIRAKGFVLQKEKPFFVSSDLLSYPLANLRQYLQTQALRYLPSSQTSPWIIALMIGERSGIPQEEWQVLRNTGTNHLMAIAGLHIGFLSGLAHFITEKIWRRRTLWMLKLPAPEAGACAALIMALFYSALAGFSIPTQRAVFMISIYLMAKLKRRVLPLSQAWSLALIIVLIINPLSVLSSSFWLSFATLALILYGLSGRIAPQGFWWKWGRPQWVIALGLLPLSLWIFGQYSWISFLANTLAIPWVGFLVLPLCFVSVILLLIFPVLAHFTLILADKSLSLLWSILTLLSQFSSALWQQTLPHYGYLLASLVAVLILLLPAGIPGRFLGLFWLLPIIFLHPNPPEWGTARFTLLDVGQGLSAVVQTQRHTLIFDTGARLSPELDMGASVVLPFLHSQGIKQIDKLIISHGDNDHRGGAEALLQALPVFSIETSVPLFFSAWPATYCLAGTTWQWEGVRFTFLHPTREQLNQGNDSSCVLQVATEKKRILLTGDLEKQGEQDLLAYSPDLSADILVAPHHGSKTSGLRKFIGSVHPQYVLYATGYRNRYHFPHPQVVQTYREWGVVQYETAYSGAIQFTLGKEELLPPSLYRRTHRHYWNEM